MCQTPRARRSTQVGQMGCTLIELLIILSLESLIAIGVSRAVMGKIEEARQRQTLMAMRQVEQAVTLWQAWTGGSCPHSLKGLVSMRLLPHEPRDAWGRPLHFARCDRGGITLYSLGADGKPHTRDDVLSWARRDPRWVAAPPPSSRRTDVAVAAAAGLVLLFAVLRRLPLLSRARSV